MSSLVKIRMPRHNHEARDGRFKQLNYSYAAPFFENVNGVLIHRVMALYRLQPDGREPWWIVDYWCGNGGRSNNGDEGLLFDPGSKLVCARCEAIAVAKGEKNSSQLAGRHVCIGVCRPVNVCKLHGEK